MKEKENSSSLASNYSYFQKIISGHVSDLILNLMSAILPCKKWFFKVSLPQRHTMIHNTDKE